MKPFCTGAEPQSEQGQGHGHIQHECSVSLDPAASLTQTRERDCKWCVMYKTETLD